MKKKLQFLSILTIVLLSATLVNWSDIASDSVQDYQKHLELRKARKENKKLSAKGLADHEKRLRGLIVPDISGAEKMDKNAVTYPAFNKIKEYEKALRNIDKSKAGSTATWTERGPGNFSGRVTSIAVDPNNINIIYVGTAGGGVFKTLNKGTSWTAVTETLPNLTITRVAMSANNSSVIYAGTGDTFANDGAGDGIYKSTNSGATWTRLSSTENTNFLYTSNIIVNPTNENHLVVATTSGIFYSTNGGSTFSSSNMTSIDVTSIAAKHNDFNTQYATSYTVDGNGNVTAGGIYRSTNAGVSWSQALNLGTSRQRMTIAVSESSTATAYVMAEGTDGKGYFYKTTNSGSSWSTLSQTGSFQNVFQTHGENVSGGQGWYDQAIVVNPNNANEVYIGGIDLYRASSSSNNMALTRITHGYSWSPDAGSSPYVHVDQHAAVAVKTGSSSFELFFGNDGGFWHSTNSGNSFSNKTNGLRNVQFYSVQKHPSSYKFVAGAQDNGTFVSPTTPSETSNWGSEKIGGDGFGVAWNAANSSQVIGGSQYGNLLRSTNSGSSFSSFSKPWSTGSGNAPFINSIGNSSVNGNRLLYSASNKIHISSNFGSSWTSKNLPRSGYVNTRSTNVVSPANADYLWVTDAIGVISGTSLGVMKSTNGGSTWSETSVPTELQSGAWYSGGLAAHPTDVNTVYLLMSLPDKPHVFRSTNGGTSWSSISTGNGFPNVATYCLAVNPNNTNEIWVGTEIGLFISTDNGASWQYGDNGLAAVMVRQITFEGSTAVVATFGRGLYTAELSTPVTLNTPTGLAASGITTSSITVSWTDNNTQEDGYKVERALGNGSFAEVATVTGSSYTSSSLASDTDYRFRVRAYKGGSYSGYSSIITATTDEETITVNAPSAVSLASKTTNQIAFSWSDNSSNESGFKIERKTTGAYTEIATVSANTESYTNTGLSPNTQYTYRVRAYAGSVNSSYSNELVVTTDNTTSGSDNFEPNNSFAAAASIAVNATVSSFIQSNGDEDYFVFTTTAAGAIHVSLANFPGDYDVFLYNASQTELGRGYTTADPEIIDHTATAAGTFYIRVDGYQSASSSTDDYELLVTFTETATASWHYVTQTIESPHNYSNNYNDTKTYSQPGAQRVAVHFSQFTTETNYDFVYIRDGSGTEIEKHHGNKAAFWAIVDGSEIRVNLVSDYSVTKYGYKIDQVAYYSSSVLSKPGKISGDHIFASSVISEGSLVHINNEKGNAVEPFASKESGIDGSVPNSFSVGAYPNPFNPTTTIKIDLTEQALVRVDIINSLGQHVKTIHNGVLAAGTHNSIQWNATNKNEQKVASGVYFYRVQAGAKTTINKIVLLK